MKMVEYFDVAPIKLKRNETLTAKTYPTFNTALDEFYSRTTTAAKAKAEIQTGDLKHEQEKLRRMVTEQQLSSQKPRKEPKPRKSLETPFTPTRTNFKNSSTYSPQPKAKAETTTP